jgi:alcohol dehydrogenase (cytochrome c)
MRNVLIALLCIAGGLRANEALQTTASPSWATGTWRAGDLPGWAGGWTLVVRNDGASLSGAVTNCPRAGAVTISDIQTANDGLRFTCSSEDGESQMSFIGRRDGDAISFTWELEGRPVAAGQVAPQRFAAARVSDVVGTMVMDRITERRRTTRPPFAPVTFDRISQGNKEPQNWLTYSGNLLGHRHSPLDQITRQNVSALELAWIWPRRGDGRFEATPLVAEGVLYTVDAPNDVVALDAITGQELWRFSYTPAPTARATGGGGRPNRGLAMLGEMLFLGTLDAHLIALDARTGRVMWNSIVANNADPGCKPPQLPRAPCYVITHAPLVVRDKVIVGTGGGDGDWPGYGIRGSIAAFDAKTGQELWRFFTTPAPGQPGHETWSGDSWKTGGAGVWMTGTYDPELNVTYWGTGNPVPTSDGRSRIGDNLYSSSVVALDADTGVLKWHYQFSPHDEKDWDAAQVPVLADVPFERRMRKLMLFANKNGMLYMLDRVTGALVHGRPFVPLDWNTGFDQAGRPLVVRERLAATSISATNWSPTAFNPRTNWLYIPARERKADGPGNAHGIVLAVDASTGQTKWQFKQPDTWFSSGLLATATGVVFAGSTGDSYSGPVAARLADGYFSALDGESGQLLWRTSLTSSVNGSPMTYSAGGNQYVAVAAGNFLFSFALRR